MYDIIKHFEVRPYKEQELKNSQLFPVDIFISDNLKIQIIADPHWHDCYEIQYILEGTAEQQINDKYFKAYKHDMVILRQGDIHSTYCRKGENTKVLVIKFLPEVFENSLTALFESKYITSFLNQKYENKYHLEDTSNTSLVLFNIFAGLYKEFNEKKSGYEIFIKGYIYQLIAVLVRSGIIGISNTDIDKDDLLKLDSLFKYIEKHYNEKIDLKKAANILNLSCSYFSRYFKKAIGRTFKEYIDYVRICEVEKMLLTKNINISQAAYEAGFNNISSFNRIFKRVRGYSPSVIKKTKTAKK